MRWCRNDPTPLCYILDSKAALSNQLTGIWIHVSTPKCKSNAIMNYIINHHNMHVDFISALQWQFNIQRYGSNLINSKCFNSHKIGDHYKDRVYERLCVLSIYWSRSGTPWYAMLFDLFLVLDREVSSRWWMIYFNHKCSGCVCVCARVSSWADRKVFI